MLGSFLRHWRIWRDNRRTRQIERSRNRTKAVLVAVHINSASAVSQRRLK